MTKVKVHQATVTILQRNVINAAKALVRHPHNARIHAKRLTLAVEALEHEEERGRAACDELTAEAQRLRMY